MLHTRSPQSPAVSCRLRKVDLWLNTDLPSVVAVQCTIPLFSGLLCDWTHWITEIISIFYTPQQANTALTMAVFLGYTDRRILQMGSLKSFRPRGAVSLVTVCWLSQIFRFPVSVTLVTRWLITENIMNHFLQRHAVLSIGNPRLLWSPAFVENDKTRQANQGSSLWEHNGNMAYDGMAERL